MGGETQDSEQASKQVTVVVNRKIKPGCETSQESLVTNLGIIT
jgi:hypothetical protein